MHNTQTMSNIRLNSKLKLCVYCGSKFGSDPSFESIAKELAKLMVQNNFDLVYGGGKVGLMGVVSGQVMSLGGEVTGVIPGGLFGKEVADTGITSLRVVGSMHERKALMESLSDGFVILPGGWGTMDEFFEILTWAQIGLHNKPIGILNHNGFYDLLLAQMQAMNQNGFVNEANQKLFFVGQTPAELIDKMKAALVV